MRRSVGRKRKASTKKSPTTRRRRRVSGVFGKGDMMTALGLIAGGIAAREASNIVSKMFPGTSLQTIAIGQIGVGFLAPHFIKNSFVKSMGDGMKVIGGTQLAVGFGIISGVPQTMPLRIAGKGDRRAVAGKGDMHVVSGKGDMNTVSGRKAARSFGNHC